MLPVDARDLPVGDGTLNPPAEGGLRPPAEGGLSPVVAGVARVVPVLGVCLAHAAAVVDGLPQLAAGEVGLAGPAAGVSLACPPPGDGLRTHAAAGGLALATPAPLGGVGGIGRPVVVVGTLKAACGLGISPPPPCADRPIQVGFLLESTTGRGFAICALCFLINGTLAPPPPTGCLICG